VPVASPPAPAFTVALDSSVSLAALTASSSSSLGTWARYDHLPTLDELAHYRGFALYRATVDHGGVLAFGEVRDRAQLFLDGDPVGVLSRDHHDSAIVLPRGGVLTILVEDQGRVNYGQRIGEHKGLIGPALLDGSPIDDWEVLALRFDDLSALFGGGGEPRAASASNDGPVRGIAGPSFARGGFVVDEPIDLFLSTASWGKGNAFVNGFNLGRFWSRGPATTLYVPGPLLRPGENELVVFETLAIAEPVARFVAAPELGHTDF